MPESCWRNVLTRTGLIQHWTDFCGRLTLQGLQTGSPAAAENVRSAQETMQMSVQMATTLGTNCNWWYCVRTAKATFPYWKLLFLSSIFKHLLLKNCAVDFVEICNFCTRKVIIKAAKRIFNSDKICRSYCDFYFGVTFWNTLYNFNTIEQLRLIYW